MLMALCHSDTSGWQKVDDLSELSELRVAEGNLLWAEADVTTLDERDVQLIAEEFGLHPLAVEDAVHTRQRPKLERYENHLFLVVHQLNEIEGQLEAVQIGCFVGNGYVLTLHAGASKTIEAAKQRWTEISQGHASYLLHTLIDVVVDDYQKVADRLESEIEELEEIALASPEAPIQHHLYSVKQRVSRLRRYVVPESRLLEQTMQPDDRAVFSERTVHLFRDVQDHLLRITDQVRNIDDLSDAVLDLTRNFQTAKLNETSRKLSAWAAIFAVQTLIAGIYGMNFELLPEENSLTGFWFALALMVTTGFGLFFYFRRKEWL